MQRLDITKFTFYNWLKRFEGEGLDGLHDRKPSPESVWNKRYGYELALERPELSPRELAVSYTDHGRFISESSAYRLLKAQHLMTSPAYILLQAADRFQQPTRRVHAPSE